MYRCGTHKGFTLIELMVVIGIIFIVLSVLTASFLEARSNGRDKQRVSDLTQIEFAMGAFLEVQGHYPELNNPTEIANGYIRIREGSLGRYWDEDVEDPLYDLSDETYMYILVPELDCEGELFFAVIATAMENPDSANGAAVCPGNSTYENSYIVIVDGPFTSASTTYTTETGTNWWEETENQTWLDDLEGYYP